MNRLMRLAWLGAMCFLIWQSLDSATRERILMRVRHQAEVMMEGMDITQPRPTPTQVSAVLEEARRITKEGEDGRSG